MSNHSLKSIIPNKRSGNKYITLPNGKSVKLFTINSEGVPIFSSQFLRLWALLFDVGKTGAPSFVGLITTFTLPSKSTSTLRGTPYLTDPRSIVRVYSFNNPNLEGPIRNEGFALETSSEDLDLQISWNIENLGNDQNVKIGFYRSNGFVYNTTNTLSLICGDRGPALFNRSQGSFRCSQIGLLYVASDRDVIINLEVTVVVPRKRISPLVTPEKPYVKYMKVYDKCNSCTKWSLPVYKIRAIQQENAAVIHDKQATSIFKTASQVINKYLRETALSITLFDDEPNQQLGVLRLMPKQIKTYENVATREYNAGTLSRYVNVSMNTNDIPDRDDEFANMYQGIKLTPPENSPPGTVPKITFNIEVNFPGGLEISASVWVQYLTSGRWPTHSRLNEKGEVVGDAIFPEDGTKYVLSPYNLHVITHSFILKEDARDFGITIYYNTDRNTDRTVADILRSTKFRKITVEWIQVPTS